MEKQTIIFTALPNGRMADGALKLSVFIAPRLWNDDPAVTKMKLGKFPDLLDWTELVRAATWQVAFEGGPTLAATADTVQLRKDLWIALFNADTDVLPFQFDDYRGAEIETFSSAQIHDYLTNVYVRAATDPLWGAGRDLPALETVAADPDIMDIALASHPRPFTEDSAHPAPIDLGGKGPRPNRMTPGPATDGSGCLSGCLAIPFIFLARIFPALKPLVDRLTHGDASPDPDPDVNDQPNLPVEPFPELPQAAVGQQPASPVENKGPFFEPPPGPPSATRRGFDQLDDFLKPFSNDSHPLPTAEELKEIYDFHRMISSLGDYPGLMRRLGMVIDIVVPLDGTVPPAEGTVKIIPGGFGPIISTPRTHYVLSPIGFVTQPRPVDPEIRNGFLRFDDPRLFRVVQVDTVGSGQKIRNTATNIMGFRNRKNRAPNMPDTTGLPALRSAGISVVRLNPEAELRDQFDRSFALHQSVTAIDNAPQQPPPANAGAALPPSDELFAEDLVRGYRIDVFDSKSSTWHSLCQRDGTYTFLADLDVPRAEILVNIQDEGFVQFGATEPLKPAADKKLRATDSLFVWDGWSLSAPRPGLSIMHPGADPETVTLETPRNEAKTNFKLETEFKATKKSLPRFRYDYTYRLRARVCDLAGNSIVSPRESVEFAKDVPEQTTDFPCARFEPVSPPAVLLRAKPVEGESLERLVVRTGDGIGVESQTTERHIIPPKVSQLMAEMHGRFDGASKMDGSAVAYDRAAREAGSLTDEAEQIQKEGAVAAEASDPWAYKGAQFKVPYLPDPSSRGALLLGLPGMNADEIIEPTPLKRVNKIPFDGPWPDPLPFRVRLVAIPAGTIPAAPKWEDGPGEEAKRVLTIELAAAQQYTVRLSSYLQAEDLNRQGVHQWVQKEAPGSAPVVESDTVSGRSWLHLPWRDITLVHAVLKPLKLPNAYVTSSPFERQLGETFALLNGTVTSDSASTGKIDLHAEWVDDVDSHDPSTLPGLSSQKAFICQLQVETGQDITPILDSSTQQKIKHSFGDTKYHRVRYLPSATTRFREYFPESITSAPSNISVEGPASAEVDIYSSKRPDAPKILYVIPTYEWVDEAAAAPGTVSRTRKGGGLRVYFDRPWYSSGSGELLGVVFMEEQNFLTLAEYQTPFVTQWGVDPIWRSPAADVSATEANFEGFTHSYRDLTLEERDDIRVSVVGYVAEFDPDRKIWFADIKMNTGTSYMPFVRLALVRYQPMSIEQAELSRVVRAEFAQYAPDRSASVTIPDAAGTKIHVLVSGGTYDASSVTMTDRKFWRNEPNRTGSAEIEAILQKRIPGMGNDPHLGWETVSTTLLGDDQENPRHWEGDVPLDQPLGSGTFRILLQEYEWYRSDFEAEDAIEAARISRRIVYADAFLIS